MDFGRLRTLRELSLRHTMAAVADAMRVSSSAVSQQIAQLEAQLEIELVERRGRGVRLTPAGQRLVSYADRLTGLIEEAKSDIAAMRSVVSGEIRLAAFPSIAATVIPRTVRALRQEFPQLLVVLEELESTEGLAALRSWQVDVALVDDLSLGGLAQDAGIEIQRVMDDELLAMLPRTHTLAKRKSIALEELKDDRWALDVSGTFGQRIIDLCDGQGFRPLINANCSGFPAIAAMVSAGCSVSIMPALRVRNSRGSFHVARLRPSLSRTIMTAYRREAQHKPAIAALLSQIQAIAQSAARS
jgi:DNA-binding transcriptional LysR family regulator